MQKRDLLTRAGMLSLALAVPILRVLQEPSEQAAAPRTIRLFLCGDVMTGRGVDQVLPHPGDPRLHERYVRTAVRYGELAEEANGPIPKPVDFAYVWGDALEELQARAPDARIMNLETAVTDSGEPWEGKGVHYRMHPANTPCLKAARIDCCALANNHVLDWGYPGLAETLATLEEAEVGFAGAGRDREAAEAPAIVEVPGKGRVLVFSLGSTSSGIPSAWAAAEDRAGVYLLEDLSDGTVAAVAAGVKRVKGPRDVVVASIHWGDNWGYRIPPSHRRFAHALVERAGVDVLHGHSSHHPRGIEVHRGKLILYGCGDFLNDYEGIGGREEYRSDLTLMIFADVDPATGELARLAMTPMRIERFRSNRASSEEAGWLADTLTRVGRPLGTSVEPAEDGTLTLRW